MYLIILYAAIYRVGFALLQTEIWNLWEIDWLPVGENSPRSTWKFVRVFSGQLKAVVKEKEGYIE